MRILYVITGLGQGGAERVVCDLADKMYEKGYDVKIAYLTGEVLTLPSNPGIEVVKVGLTNAFSLPKCYLNLSKIIRSYEPDVIHSHMVHANLLTRLVRLVTPMNKLISTAHSSNEGGYLRMLVYRATNQLADLTTNVSCNASLSFESKKAVPKNAIITVYNGINLKKFEKKTNAKLRVFEELGLSNKDKMILSVGRFADAKDYPTLLNAISSLKNEVSYPFKLVIAGDGELRSSIEDSINVLNLKDNVILLGRREDIPYLMSAADLFVLSSKFEGFGLVVAEAMACRCLVVSTECGGVVEVMQDENFLVPLEDEIALKNRIKYALNITNEHKNEIIFKNLVHVHENFSLEIIVDKWISIYRQ